MILLLDVLGQVFYQLVFCRFGQSAWLPMFLAIAPQNAQSRRTVEAMNQMAAYNLLHTYASFSFVTERLVALKVTPLEAVRIRRVALEIVGLMP